MDEYNERAMAGSITVIKVKKHKTGKYGSAKLTLDEYLAKKLDLL